MKNANLLLPFLTVLLVFFIIFSAFQNTFVYKHSLGLFADNWEINQGNRILAHNPYTKISNNKLIRWDAAHYQLIKDHGYDINVAGGDYIFAFFPLFPALWKVLHLPPLGIPFLNYILFVLSIIILVKLLSKKEFRLLHVLLSLSLPGLIIFLIPYSEALFLITTTVGIYGWIKRKYWIYFIGLLLASVTRPAFTILALSILCTEIYFFFQHKNIITTIKNTSKNLLPLLTGTLIVSVIQKIYGSENLFTFIKVQKYWDNSLAIPHNLRDWSHEGFAINIGVIFFLFAPLLIILFLIFTKILKNKISSISFKNNAYPFNYLLILSIIYIVGSSFFILLFRGGSLHCLFRFTLCTPFMFVLLFNGFKFIRKIPGDFRFFILATLSLLSLFVLGVADYSTYWNFSDAGIFILILFMFLWVFQEYAKKKAYKIILYVNILMNVTWTTYLFNTYLADGWIFA